MEQAEPGEKIKALRIKAGLSQEELAEASGLSVRSIQRIENGKTVPRGDSLKRISNALHVGIETLTSDPSGIDIVSVGKPEREYTVLLVLILSAFGYLLSPYLGLIFPSLIWLLFRKESDKVNDTGLLVIRIELLWCLLLSFVYFYIFCTKILHMNLPVPSNKKWIIILMSALYFINAAAISFVLIRWITSQKTLRKAHST